MFELASTLFHTALRFLIASIWSISLDSKPKISTRPGKGFNVTQTVKQADQGGVQGVSI